MLKIPGLIINSAFRVLRFTSSLENFTPMSEGWNDHEVRLGNLVDGTADSPHSD
jgi:hypothetical protein